jgi:hypothetical protein
MKLKNSTVVAIVLFYTIFAQKYFKKIKNNNIVQLMLKNALMSKRMF